MVKRLLFAVVFTSVHPDVHHLYIRMDATRTCGRTGRVDPDRERNSSNQKSDFT